MTDYNEKALWVTQLCSTSPSKLDSSEIIKLGSFFADSDPDVPQSIIDNACEAYYLFFTLKNDSQMAYDAANIHIGIINSKKGCKKASVLCLNSIFKAVGSSIMSLAPLAIISLNKSYKSSDSDAGLNASIVKTCSTIINKSGKTIADSSFKSLWKMAKSSSLDKSVIISCSGFDLLKEIISTSYHFKIYSDLEAVKLLILKGLASNYSIVREHASKCFAKALILSIDTTSTEIINNPEDDSKATSTSNSTTTNTSNSTINKTKPKKKSNNSPLDLSLHDAFELLTNLYIKSSIDSTDSLNIRSGIVETFIEFLFLIDSPQIIEQNYLKILNSWCFVLSQSNLNLSSSSSSSSSNSYSILKAREHLNLINNIIFKQLFGEFGRLSAIKLIITNLINVTNTTVSTSSETLIAYLSSMSNLIKLLGSAISEVQDQIKSVFVQLLSNSSQQVQINTCACLKVFVLAMPAQIIPLMTICLNSVNRELHALKSSKSNTNNNTADSTLGFAYALATLTSISPLKRNYTSLDITTRILSIATSILKSSTNTSSFEKNLNLSIFKQIRIAWILLTGLMNLGPDFMKIHLSQMLLFWRSAVSRQSTKDDNCNIITLSYLLDIRYSALTCILSFIKSNERLITNDVSKRLGVIFQNATGFINGIPPDLDLKQKEEKNNRKNEIYWSFKQYTLMIKKRTLQCYLKMSNISSAQDIFHANVLVSTVVNFADPTQFTKFLTSNITTNSSSSAITPSSSSSSSPTDSPFIGDNLSFGVTSYYRINCTNRDLIFPMVSFHDLLDYILKKPISGALEYDSGEIYSSPMLNINNNFNLSNLSNENTSYNSTFNYYYENNLLNLPLSPETEIVDLSIELFGSLFHKQTPKVQESTLEQMESYLGTSSSSSLSRNNTNNSTGSNHNGSSINSTTALDHRKLAVRINSILALHNALKINSGVELNPRVLNALTLSLRKSLQNQELFISLTAARSIGLACSIGGSTFISTQLKFIIDQIIENKNPISRASYCFTLSSILKNLGSLAAVLHLKTIYNVLTSLSKDPHPLVHSWALISLAQVMESAGLTFINLVPETLKLLIDLLLLNSHHEFVSSRASSNLSIENSSKMNISRGIHAIINILGPTNINIDENKNKTPSTILIINLLRVQKITIIKSEVFKSIQELMIFAPGLLSINEYTFDLMNFLKINIDNNNEKNYNDYEGGILPLRDVAISGLLGLIKSQKAVSSPEIHKYLWLAFDSTFNDSNLRSCIECLMIETAGSHAALWLKRCQILFTVTRNKLEGKDISKSGNGREEDLSLADDEVASMATGDNSDLNNNDSEPLKWQTKVFVLQLLRKLLQISLAHKSKQEKLESTIVYKVGDVVRLAFTASTSAVVELRLMGVRLLSDVIELFGDMKDPEFTEVSLLEQYQAQIGSALTPAFANDSSPELASEAINVCAKFIGSGVVQSVHRMGRILKILTSALESSSGKHHIQNNLEHNMIGDNGENSTGIMVGDLNPLSPNAQIMLKLAILSAWAHLQTATTSQSYLTDVVKPYITILVPMWLKALREFAQLRYEPEESSGLGGTGTAIGSLDHVYSSLLRIGVIKFYEQSWLQFVDAIASLIEDDGNMIFEIVDSSNSKSGSNLNLSSKNDNDKANEEDDDDGINYGEETVAFFFVLFGICFEALIKPIRSSDANSSILDSNNPSDEVLRTLRVVKKIFHPQICGDILYKDAIFAELIDLFDRLVLTHGLEIQTEVAEIARALCLNIGDDKLHKELTEDVNKSFELFRIVISCISSVLTEIHGSNFSSRSHSMSQSRFDLKNAATINFIKVCFNCLADMIVSFPDVIAIDLYSCTFNMFAQIFEIGTYREGVAPAIFMSLKKSIVGLVELAMKSGIDSSIGESASRIINIFFRQVILNLEKHELKNNDNENENASLKNTLLVSVVVITTAGDILQLKKQEISNFVGPLMHCLFIPDCFITTAQCLKTLLVFSSNKNIKLGQEIASQLIPVLVGFISSNSNEDNSIENNKIRKTVIEMITIFTKSFSDKDDIKSALSITIPVIIYYWVTSGETKEEEEYIRLKMNELAAVDGESFRDIVKDGLSVRQRNELEKIVKSGGSKTTVEYHEPQIQLKMFN